MRIIKEEWRNIKPSILRYHKELRRELREGLIQSLRTELEPALQRLLGEDWKEESEKYLHKLEEEERKMCIIIPKKDEKKKEIKKVKIRRKKEENQKRT